MNITIHALDELNVEEVKHIDKYSGFNVHTMLDSDAYAWGIFSNNKLIGYCTLGYADVLNNAEFEVNVDDLLLSDVFIIKEYRDKGLATLLINYVLTNAASNVFVYATILDIKLKHYYKRFGFETVNNDDYLLVRK